MKTYKVFPDGMYEREEFEGTDEELWSIEKYYYFPDLLLSKSRKQSEVLLEKLHGLKGDGDKRARDDLQRLIATIEDCEAAMRNKQWNQAITFAILFGSLIAKTGIRRQLETDVLSGREQRSGWKSANTDETTQKQDRYREYVSDFNRIKAASRNKDKHPIVTKLAKKYGVGERTIYRALKESTKKV